MITKIFVIDGRGEQDVIYKTVDKIDTTDLGGSSSVAGLASYKLASTGEAVKTQGDEFVSLDGERTYRRQ